MLRILSAVVLVVLVTAGCGGSARPDRSASRGLPRVLANAWASQASAVATAAASGDNCHALQLAAALRTDVLAKEAQVPARLRPALFAGVNALADRIVCQPPPQTVTEPQKKPEPRKHDHHDHHDHHKHGDGQGNEG